MNDFERLKVLLYQYILFKGSYYDNQVKDAKELIKHSKDVTSDLALSYYDNTIALNTFNSICDDLLNLLNSM